MISSSLVGGFANAWSTRSIPPDARSNADVARTEHVGAAGEDVEHGWDRGRRRVVGRGGVRVAGACEVRVLLRLREGEEVVVLDARGVAFDQRGQREVLAFRLHRVVELVEVEVLVLQRVRELVHERDPGVDVGQVGAAHEERLAVLVVEADGVGGAEVALRLDEVDRTLDEPDGAELTGDALGFLAVLLGDLRVAALELLHERGIGEELHPHRVLELQLPVALHELHVLRDPRIPVVRCAGGGRGGTGGEADGCDDRPEHQERRPRARSRP